MGRSLRQWDRDPNVTVSAALTNRWSEAIAALHTDASAALPSE
jgi:hypothetical protein